jgi:DNA ligase 1
MAKSLTGIYKPGARVGSMIKIKEALETLDLVIVKAEWGEGKRAKWLSSFTLALRNENEFLEVGKVGSGLKEKEESGVTFEEITRMLEPLIISEEDEKLSKTKNNSRDKNRRDTKIRCLFVWICT